MHEAEAVVVEDLKDEIEEAATRVKDSLPEKVKKIRNEVVQEVTGKKLVNATAAFFGRVGVLLLHRFSPSEL